MVNLLKGRFRNMIKGVGIPECPRTQYFRTLVPKTMPLMAFGTRVLKYWVLGPCGYALFSFVYGVVTIV